MAQAPDASRMGNAEPYGDMPADSPTTLVLNYLKSKGLQLNNENVRRTLEQSARDPSFIPGLRSEAPPPADQQGGASGNKPSVAGKIESSGDKSLPTPPIPPEGAQPGGSPTTSAQPGDGSGLDVSNIGRAILGMMGGAGIGAAAAYPFLGRGAGGDPNAIPMPPPSAATGQPGAGDGGRYDVLPPPEPSPFDIAMGRAVAPANGVPQLGYDASGANLDAVLNSGRLPPGVSPTDAVNAGQGVQGVTGSSMPGPNEGNIPLPKRKVTIEEVHPPITPRAPAPKFWLPR